MLGYNMSMKSGEFDRLRRLMVDAQLISRGISDKRVLDAMSKVPRHLFVPERDRAAAYEDSALPIGSGQTISQPYIVAVMTELLGLKGGERVLEIGTGSGYQAAVLGLLAGQVFTVERIELLARGAEKTLQELGYRNIKILSGDGSLGLESEAPFDGIIVTAACPEIPPPLLDQLADGGRLVTPVGERHHQVLIRAEKQKGRIVASDTIGCVFVPLLGKFGWHEPGSP